jgi:hypothetical protein
MNADELLEWRQEFPILERTTYLISNSLGAMPRGVYDRLREYAHTWDTRGVRAWEEGWWEMAVRVTGRVRPKSWRQNLSLDPRIPKARLVLFCQLQGCPNPCYGGLRAQPLLGLPHRLYESVNGARFGLLVQFLKEACLPPVHVRRV